VPAAAAWFAAATATRDARLQKLALQHHDAMRQGQALGDLLEGCRELPLSFIRAYQTGEHSGQLERVLPQQAQLAREAGQARLKQFAFWFPKLIFLLLAGVVAWSVVQGFQEILAPLHELLESEGL